MGADQIAAIRPALNELFLAAQNREPGAENLCASFTVPDYPTVWMQIQLGTINASYPPAEEPMAFLERVGIPVLPQLALDSWEAGLFATFTHDPCSLYEAARFVDRLLVALHNLHPEDYEIDVAFERLSA